jgi:GxxExxY protein
LCKSCIGKETCREDGIEAPRLTQVTSDLPKEVEELVEQVIGCLITVHRILGPGFREVIYSRALSLELDGNGIKFEREKDILVPYKQWLIPGHRLDTLIGGVLLVENKTVPRLRDIHRRQVLSYLRAADLRIGLLVNFSAPVLKGNIRRVIR